MIVDESIDQLMERIEQARQWARNHFNAGNALDRRLVDENLRFLSPSFFVEFPQPDIMKVQPSLMGNKSDIENTYKLAFVGDKMKWKFQKLEIDGQLIPKDFHRHMADLDVN